MLLLFHIIIALASLGLGTYSYIKTSKRALQATYLAGFGTFMSGVLLIVSHSAYTISTCIIGLSYFVLLSMLMIAARHRLAARASLFR